MLTCFPVPDPSWPLSVTDFSPVTEPEIPLLSCAQLSTFSGVHCCMLTLGKHALNQLFWVFFPLYVLSAIWRFPVLSGTVSHQDVLASLVLLQKPFSFGRTNLEHHLHLTAVHCSPSPMHGSGCPPFSPDPQPPPLPPSQGLSA